jgi:hypothetical protein
MKKSSRQRKCEIIEKAEYDQEIQERRIDKKLRHTNNTFYIYVLAFIIMAITDSQTMFNIIILSLVIWIVYFRIDMQGIRNKLWKAREILGIKDTIVITESAEEIERSIHYVRRWIKHFKGFDNPSNRLIIFFAKKMSSTEYLAQLPEHWHEQIKYYLLYGEGFFVTINRHRIEQKIE